MHLEAILFDLGNTLVTHSIKEKILIREALKNIDAIISKNKTKSREIILFSECNEVYMEIDLIRNKLNIEIPLEIWLSKLLIRVYGDEFSEELLNIAKRIMIEARSSYVKTFDKVPEVLNKLKSKYLLGIISNTSSSDVVFRVLSNLKIIDFFDNIITSAEFGVRKPYPGIFLHALRELNIKEPNMAVFVGDSLKYDITGAKNIGMKAILFDKDSTQKGVSHADIIISTIEDLPKALEKLE